MVGDHRPLDIAPPLMVNGLEERDIEALAQVFKALSDPQRIDIVNLIGIEQGATVSAIAEDLGISQSRASYHVKQLVDAGVIEGEREGNVVWYGLVDGALGRLAGIFLSFC